MGLRLSALVGTFLVVAAAMLSAHPHHDGDYAPPHDPGEHAHPVDRGRTEHGAPVYLEVESRPSPPNGMGGRRVVISPGHGRTWNEQNNWWGWQRDSVHFGEVEDLITPRIVNRWLVKYFENAGATVVTTRERDEQLHEVRLDDQGTSTVVTGQWTTFSGGAAHSIFAAWQASARWATAQSEPGGPSVTWHASIPQTDRYGLRIWYPFATNATPDAQLIIHTAAGDVRAMINQTQNQGRWLWVDEFVFPAGANVPIATLTTESQFPGTVVVADAIRLGGGMGDYDGGGGVSGLPRWQEYSKSWSKFYGAPASVWDKFVVASDFSVRSAYIGWEPIDLFYEVHTNAAGAVPGSQTGTMVVWTQAPTQEKLDIFQQGHLDMIQMLRTHWLPTWRDDGFLSPNVTGWPSINAVVEVAYHDRLEPDMLSLLDPDFRRLASRAMYQKAVAAITLNEAVFLPEPPEAPAVGNLGSGAIRVSWAPPLWGPDVDSYRVFESLDGFAFDLGTDVGDVLSVDLDGFDAGDVRYYQVRAINAGGRSFPTETVGVRVGDGQPLLVVNGFDRLDRLVQEADNPRYFVRDAIAAFGAADETLAIDSAANEAVVEGRISLGDAQAVVWMLGKESRDDETFSAAEQPFVADFLDGGGRLFVSGTDLAHDLISHGTAGDKLFARTKLFLGSAGTRTTNRNVVGAEGTPFESLAFSLSGLNQKPYQVDAADVLAVDISGSVVLEWGDGSGAAGVAFAAGPSKTLVLAAPFEAVMGLQNRVDLASAVLDFLRAPLEPDTTGPQLLNLRVTDIGPNSVTIRWETDEPATSVLRWGPTAALGTVIVLPGDQKLAHSSVIAGLDPDTLYYYEVESTDFFGNPTTSTIESFTTGPPDTDPPIITLLRVSAVSDRDAIVRYATDEPASTGARWGTSPGSLPSMVSIPSEYAEEHVLRIAPLAPNTTYYVAAVSEDIAGNAGDSTIVQFQTFPTFAATMVDNVDPGYSDTGWAVGAFGSQMIGTNYTFASTSPGGTMVAEWVAPVPVAGHWQAWANFTSGANRSAAAPYTVHSALDEQLININQQFNGGIWAPLGSDRYYAPNHQFRVTLSNNTDQSGVVIGDAIRWMFVRLSTETPEAIADHDGWMLY